MVRTACSVTYGCTWETKTIHTRTHTHKHAHTQATSNNSHISRLSPSHYIQDCAWLYFSSLFHTHTPRALSLSVNVLRLSPPVSCCSLCDGFTLCCRCTRHVCVFRANWVIQLDRLVGAWAAATLHHNFTNPLSALNGVMLTLLRCLGSPGCPQSHLMLPLI